MGNCFQSNVPNRVQLNDVHLLGQDVKTDKQHNFTNSEQPEFQYSYRGFNTETSITSHSNLNPVFPSNNSSPKNRPIKSNQMIYGNVNNANPSNAANANSNNINNMDNYHELQRQIDILKQCSSEEIKMLKTRIQTLEKQFKQIRVQNASNTNVFRDDDYKENEITFMNAQCTKGTPTKSCPNLLRIIKISQIYHHKMLQSSKDSFHAFEAWNIINNELNIGNKYDLKSLINDYCHLLEIHCNNNNIFELRIISLEIASIIKHSQSNKCIQTPCKCMINIHNQSFKPQLFYVLNVIHCFLYHYNQQQRNDHKDDSLQRLRDCIMYTNDEIINYHKNPNKSNNSFDLFKLNDRNVVNAQPVLMNNKLRVAERHNSINSVASNLSRQSTPHSPSPQSVSVSISISPLSASVPVARATATAIKQQSAIEMSVERVRKLSAQINEDDINALLEQYDNGNNMNQQNVNIAIETESENDNENGSDSLNETDRAEIENFKLKLENIENCERPRRGSKHNLMRLQQGKEWDVDSMDQTAKDMKRQLFHLAVTSRMD